MSLVPCYEPEVSEETTWTAVLDEAAEHVRGRIRADAARFPDDEAARSLLEYLEAHLFDFDLDVNRWLAATGCPRAARDRFVSRLGPLKEYLDGQRIAVAAEVVRQTSAPIGKIGRRVGFPVPRTFQRTFERVIGRPPKELRALSPAAPEESRPGAAPDASDPEHGTRLSVVYWRRQVALGLIDAGRVAELRGLLLRRYEVLRQPPGRRGRFRMRGLLRDMQLWTGDEDELRARAFRMTDGAIEHDARRVERELVALLYAIHRHLFEPTADLDRIRATAGFHQSSVWRRLERVLGQSPWSYVREARLETAAVLLLSTPLKIVTVSRLVGYASRTTFHRSFAELAGLSPTEYRRRARRLLERAGWPPFGESEAAEYWERAVSGELKVRESLRLDEYLGDLSRALAPRTAARRGPASGPARRSDRLVRPSSGAGPLTKRDSHPRVGTRPS